jgi:hypothetical protein
MKKMTLLLTVILAASALAVHAFTPPGADEVAAAAENPDLVPGLIEGASNEQAANVVLRVIREIEQSDLALDLKKAHIAEVFAAVQQQRGEEDSAIVLSDVARRMNPELLPSVGASGAGPVAGPNMPIALPLAPPLAPEYEGQ